MHKLQSIDANFFSLSLKNSCLHDIVITGIRIFKVFLFRAWSIKKKKKKKKKKEVFMRQFLYGTWKPVSTRPPYPEIHVILYSSPWTGHLPSCITAFIQSCAKMRVFTAGNMQDTLKTLRSRAASPCFIDQLTIALFWTKAFFQFPSMISYSNQNWNDDLKFSAKISWGSWRPWAPHWRRRWVPGRARGPRGRDRAADPSFPLRPRASTVVIHLRASC